MSFGVIILAISAIGGILGSLLLLSQVRIMNSQSVLLDRQNSLLDAQNAIQRSSASASLYSEMRTVLAGVEERALRSKEPNETQSLSGIQLQRLCRVARLSAPAEPGTWSALRGDLVAALVDTGVVPDKIQFNREDTPVRIFQRLPLSWADLSDLEFLRKAELKEASLPHANMTGLKLPPGSTLEGADLRWAILRDAVLRDVNMAGAKLHCASASGTDFAGAVLLETELYGADLSGAKGLAASQLFNAKLDSGTRLPTNLSLPNGKVGTGWKKGQEIECSGESGT